MSFLLHNGIIVHYYAMSQQVRKILADKIARYRVKAGLTREQLSLLLNKDNSYISKLEKLKVNISIDVLEEIAKQLGRSIFDFIKK